MTTGATPPQSSCPANQFPCTGGCVPLAVLCNGISDCRDGEDEQSCSKLLPWRGVHYFTCVFNNLVTYRGLETEDSTVTVSQGTNVTLQCSAPGGFPSPYVTWLKNLSPLEPDDRIIVMSMNGRGSLVISDITVSDTGQYSCVLRSNMRSEIILPDTRLVVISESSGKDEWNNVLYS